MKNRRKRIIGILVCICLIASVLSGCSKGENKIVIYSNADDEAVAAITNALDANGYQGKYMIQSFGTSELGGKLLAEGKNLEADMVTMSSFYLESAQSANQMFLDLDFDTNAMDTYSSYYTPITAQEGAIIVNTTMLQENNLDMPTNLKDLADPKYQGFISVTDISSSSTAWLLIQALLDAYGEEEAKRILSDIYKNAGPHIESSGSAPIKKVRAGEVAIGFGLRHQAVRDKESGLPVDYVDPTEGNFSLTESVAILDKADKTKDLAMEMAECIIKESRKELIQTYPIALYNGETTDNVNSSAYPKVFKEKLTAELLQKHITLSEDCK